MIRNLETRQDAVIKGQRNPASQGVYNHLSSWHPGFSENMFPHIRIEHASSGLLPELVQNECRDFRDLVR